MNMKFDLFAIYAASLGSLKFESFMQVPQGHSADYDRKNENEHFSVWTRTFVAKVLPLRLSHLVFSEGAHADSNWWES